MLENENIGMIDAGKYYAPKCGPRGPRGCRLKLDEMPPFIFTSHCWAVCYVLWMSFPLNFL